MVVSKLYQHLEFEKKSRFWERFTTPAFHLQGLKEVLERFLNTCFQYLRFDTYHTRNQNPHNMNVVQQKWDVRKWGAVAQATGDQMTWEKMEMV